MGLGLGLGLRVTCSRSSRCVKMSRLGISGGPAFSRDTLIVLASVLQSVGEAPTVRDQKGTVCATGSNTT